MLAASQQQKSQIDSWRKNKVSAEVGKASRVGSDLSCKHLTKLLWFSKGKHSSLIDRNVSNEETNIFLKKS
jgi:hypothetical protein